MIKLHGMALALLCAPLACPAAGEPTSVKIGQTTYGASADERGPIGGGQRYAGVVTKGDHVVKDLDGLLDALAKARAGQTVFIPGETEIDLTARIYVEQIILEVPAGVTLAGERGNNGSTGALLTSDAHHNWFLRHAQPQQAVRAAAKTQVHDNAYGAEPKVVP
ncbi:MAG: hypothetical protein ACYC35_14615 [Pirellulales bacterium]